MDVDPLEVVRAALAGSRAWLVGGAVRDRALGRPVADLDVVLDGDPGEGARAIASAHVQPAAGRLLCAVRGFRGAWRRGDRS